MMISEIDQEFDIHSLSYQRLVNAFPAGNRKQNAMKFLEVVDRLRSVAAKADHEEEYSHWYNEIRECLSGRGCSEPLVEQLEKVVDEHDLPHQYVFDLIKGIDRESRTVEFPDFAELGTCAYLNSSPILVCLFRILANYELEEDVEQALIDLGVADYLLHKLANFLPQLKAKLFYLSHLEVQDRGINLFDQVEPIDDDLWKDLIQFQCRRIQELIQSSNCLAKLPSGKLKRELNGLVLQSFLIVKKIRRLPNRILREKVTLTWTESWKAGIQKWRSLKLPVE